LLTYLLTYLRIDRRLKSRFATRRAVITDNGKINVKVRESSIYFKFVFFPLIFLFVPCGGLSWLYAYLSFYTAR